MDLLIALAIIAAAMFAYGIGCSLWRVFHPAPVVSRNLRNIHGDRGTSL